MPRTQLHSISLLLTLFFAGTAHAFDFKGVELGSASTTTIIREKLGVDCQRGASSMQICNGRVTIASEPADMNLVIDARGIVSRINLRMDSTNFDVLAYELVKKFGNPAKQNTSTMQNSFGAKFKQTEMQWLRKGGLQMTFTRYAGSTTRSSLEFSTAEDRKFLQGLAPDRSKDL